MHCISHIWCRHVYLSLICTELELNATAVTASRLQYMVGRTLVTTSKKLERNIGREKEKKGVSVMELGMGVYQTGKKDTKRKDQNCPVMCHYIYWWGSISSIEYKPSKSN